MHQIFCSRWKEKYFRLLAQLSKLSHSQSCVNCG